MTATEARACVVEFFALRDAGRDAAALPESIRAETERSLKLAFQRRDAAKELWACGSEAEALRLGGVAFEDLVAALRAFATDVRPRPAWVDRALAPAEAASQTLSGRLLPELDADMQPDNAPLFRDVMNAIDAIEWATGPRLAAPPEIARVASMRRSNAVAVIVVGALMLVWWVRPPRITARASSQHNDDDASRALDLNLKTNWAPTDGDKGWLELALASPRPVKELRLVPFNYGYENRFLKRAHVTAYLHDMAVASMDFTFPKFESRLDPVVAVPLDAPTCDRIRIEVTGFQGTSASISEIELR